MLLTMHLLMVHLYSLQPQSYHTHTLCYLSHIRNILQYLLVLGPTKERRTSSLRKRWECIGVVTPTYSPLCTQIDNIFYSGNESMKNITSSS